jgi:hypothetical protein
MTKKIKKWKDVKGLEADWTNYYERGPVKIRVQHITDRKNPAKGYFNIATSGGTDAEQLEAVENIQQCLIETFGALAVGTGMTLKVDKGGH